jgi:DNA-binding NarL/FixJ family response regulator
MLLHAKAAQLPSATKLDDRHLSARELEVAETVALGLTNKEVGDALSISVRTVENHMRSIFAKLEINTRTRLAARLLRDRPITL